MTRAVVVTIVVGSIVGAGAIYIELTTRIRLVPLLTALVERWYLGALLVAGGALGRARDLAFASALLIIGVAWLAAAAAFFVVLVTTCATCKS